MHLLSLFLPLGLLGCTGGDKPAGDSATTGTDAGTGGTGGTSGGDSGGTSGTGDTTTDTGPVDPCEADEISVVLGTGESTYEPLEEGGEIGLVYGDQGGWHFFVGFETYQSDDIVSFSVKGYDAETGAEVCQTGDSPLQVALLTVDECRHIYYQVYCYVICPLDSSLVDGDCDNPNEVLVGRDIRLEIDLVDFQDREATDTLTFVAGAEDTNPTECISDSICAGTGK